MAEVSVDFMTKVNTWVVEPAKRAYTGLEGHWNTLGRKFTVWADTNISSPWNSVAKKILSSLPIATAIFILPLWVNAALGVGYYLANLGYGPFDNATHENVFAGVCVGSAAVTLYNAGAFISTFKPGFAIGAIIYGVMSTILFPHSKFTEEQGNEVQK